MVWRCCVPTCSKLASDKEQPKVIFRSLPDPAKEYQMYNIWVSRIGNNKLKAEKDPQSSWKKYRICDIHFSDNCRLPNEKWLKKDSLPTLALPGFYAPDNEKNSLFRHFEKARVQLISSVDISSSPAFTVDKLSCHAPLDDCLATPKARGQLISAIDISQLSSSASTVDKSIDPVTIDDCPGTPKRKTAQIVRLQSASKKQKILETVNVVRANQLSPKALKLYKKVVQLTRVKRRLNSRQNSLKEDLINAYNLSQEDFLTRLSPIAQKFFILQVGQSKKCPRGRRFSMDDKIMALSIYKQGRGGYKVLKSMGFVLPSRSTLIAMLKNVRFRSGINHHIFRGLESSVKNMHPDDRDCSLLFDEISIQPSWYYDERLDEIVGLEDHGEEKIIKFADHCQVFMLRGCRKKWKQPIAYAFSEHSMAQSVLVKMIKEIISQSQSIGLNVVATICDQGLTNMAAINQLIKYSQNKYSRRNEEYRGSGFEVNGKEVIPIFDPPHLLKGIRNNLLNKTCVFNMDDNVYKAKWRHFVDLYEKDDPNEDLKMCNKLTDYHLKTEKIFKMKVSIAAQTFSHRVGVFFNFAINHKILPEECRATQHLAFFMDKLFDSVNGQSNQVNNGKVMRVSLSKTSRHLEFWREAITVLKSMHFVDSKNKSSVPPTVKNWIRTIHGLTAIWNILKCRYKYLNLRNFNQDALENFFAMIRSLGHRYINPTPHHFVNSFLTLVINNFLSPKSPRANCEDDESEGALSNLKLFLSQNNSICDNSIPILDYEVIITKLQPFVPTNDFIKLNVTNYVAGSAARAIHKKTLCCKICKTFLISPTDQGARNNLIRNRAYSPKLLCTPDSRFAIIFQKIYYYCKQLVPNLINYKNIKYHIVSALTILIGDEIPLCVDHNLKNMIITYTVHFYLINYTKNINKILKGAKSGNFSGDYIKQMALLKSKQWCKNKTKKLTRE
ncbi:hypothetical protein PPYR_05451 [Photinus pyralis]|uniref:THAP-type domain-containing protein n=4 Tax=Photinus pyralis TaxID=7054 RepID=A0A5N4AUU5_PHOPY|nr:hypothetical protein PPYR_05451 [Photinus pyralis]